VRSTKKRVYGIGFGDRSKDRKPNLEGVISFSSFHLRLDGIVYFLSSPEDRPAIPWYISRIPEPGTEIRIPNN
jgi:hypothetical protein